MYQKVQQNCGGIQQLQGILLVKPISARLDRDTEVIGSMDCYCQVIIGQNKQNSHVHNKSGKNPQWQSQLQFKVTDEQFVRVSVWDKEMVKSDDLVGEAELDLINIIQMQQAQEKQQKKGGPIPLNIDLLYQNKKAGSVHIEFELLIDGPSGGKKPEKRKGMLVVKPTHAKLIRDTELMSQMDPYVVITLGKFTKKTKVHDSGGKTPKWTDILELRRNEEYYAEVKVYDKDVVRDDTVGEAQLSLQDLFDKGTKKESLDIFFEGKISGTVYLNLQWLPDTEQRTGTLIAYPISANLIRDTEFMGKMDPYCQIKIGQQTQKSKVHDNAGKHPRWADELQFLRTSEFEAVIDIYDEDTVSDDLVGTAHIALQDIFQQGSKAKEITIFHNEKTAGSVNIRWEWHPDTENRPGIITVKPLFAKLDRDTDTFGKMDPYCKIQLGQNFQKTKTHYKGGKTPKWDDDLVLRRQDEHFASVIIMEEDTVTDDLVGEGQVALYDLFKKGKKRTITNLLYKNKQAGTVTLEWSWKPDEELREGKIIARPLEAQLDRDTDVVGKMDCYAVLKIGEKSFKTNVCKGSGKLPVWNTPKFEFQRKQEYQALVQVWDEDLTYNDLVGEANFSLLEVFQQKKVTKWIKLFYNKEKLAGQVLVEWEWQPTPSKQDLGAENRVRFINIQQGQKRFNANITQFMVSLHDFDKLTLDDSLYRIFESLTGKNLPQLRQILTDLLKTSEYVYAEGYAELCRYFLDQVIESVPSQKSVDRLMMKFKKFLALTDILKIEIENLTAMPTCHQAVEIVQEQIELYEANPAQFSVDPYIQIKNNLELQKTQGDFSRKEVKRPPSDNQQFSNSQNLVQDKRGLKQSRAIIVESFQKDTLDNENYYYSNKKSRLNIEKKDPQSSKEAQFLEKNKVPDFNASDWLSYNEQRENQQVVEKQTQNQQFDEYQGDPPQYDQEELQQEFQQKVKSSKAQYWLSQQDYYTNPGNLPEQYQSPERKRQVRRDNQFPQNQELEEQLYNTHEQFRVSSYQNQQQQQQPFQENNSQQLQQQQQQNYNVVKGTGSKFSPQKKQITNPSTFNNNNLMQSGNNNQNLNQNPQQSQVQFTQSRTHYYNPNLPQIDERLEDSINNNNNQIASMSQYNNLNYNENQRVIRPQQQQQQIQQSQYINVQQQPQNNNNNANNLRESQLSRQYNSHHQNQNIQSMQATQQSVQEQLGASRASQGNQGWTRSQQYQNKSQAGAGGRIKKERSLFKSLFW